MSPPPPSQPSSPEHRPSQSVVEERERIIQELSLQFANDNLSLDELELRMERAYKSGTIAELQRLTADLPRTGVPAPAPTASAIPVEEAPLAPERERVISVMSETKRRGAWLVPQRLELLAVMSDTTIDLTQSTLPPGIIDIHVRCLWAAVKVIVPPGLQVVNRLSSLMGSVTGGGEPDDERRGVPAWRSGTVVRLSGWALMAEVQTKVRRRERDADHGDES
jgi:uncharacterized protein DUF1707/cell wall-active antibiotic response 4TMS protein YvqF